MFGKPVINIGFNPAEVSEEELSYARYYHFDHYRPLVEEGVVELASSREQLIELAAVALADPTREQQSQQKFLHQMFPGTLDGKSHQRVADCLLSLVLHRRGEAASQQVA